MEVMGVLFGKKWRFEVHTEMTWLVSQCQNVQLQLAKYKKGNRGFGHFNSADFLPVPFKYVLFSEFQVKSCFLFIAV